MSTITTKDGADYADDLADTHKEQLNEDLLEFLR